LEGGAVLENHIQQIGLLKVIRQTSDRREGREVYLKGKLGNNMCGAMRDELHLLPVPFSSLLPILQTLLSTCVKA